MLRIPSDTLNLIDVMFSTASINISKVLVFMAPVQMLCATSASYVQSNDSDLVTCKPVLVLVLIALIFDSLILNVSRGIHYLLQR